LGGCERSQYFKCLRLLALSLAFAPQVNVFPNLGCSA